MPEPSKSKPKPADPLEALIRAALAMPFGPDEGHIKKWLEAMLREKERSSSSDPHPAQPR
jgi:hypothetical protein